MVYLACLSGPLMWLIKVVNNSVHCHDHDHNHNHYHNHDQHKLSNEQLSNHDFLREQLDRVCKTARLAATVSLKKTLPQSRPTQIVKCPLRVTSDLIFSHCKTRHSRAECFNYREFKGGGVLSGVRWPPTKKSTCFVEQTIGRPPVTAQINSGCPNRICSVKQVLSQHQKTDKHTVVMQYVRDGFSARKLPNTTNGMVRATLTASCFRSTKLVLGAARILCFSTAVLFRSINLVHSAQWNA